MIRDCYQIARTIWGIQPSEFWAMSLKHWFWEFDTRRSDAREVSLLTDNELWESIGEKAPYG